MRQVTATRELISQAQYAKRRGCAKNAVSVALSEGRIRLIEGKIDPAVADRDWTANTRARADSRPASSKAAGLAATAPAPAEPPQEPPTGPVTYADARARREAAEATKSELELQKYAGRLVERAKVEAAVFEMFRILRDKVMAKPSICARKVIGMVELREIELAMTDELRSAFEEFERRAGERMAVKLSP